MLYIKLLLTLGEIFFVADRICQESPNDHNNLCCNFKNNNE